MLTGYYLLGMLLVPYPFASIHSIVFPFPTVSFEFARFYIWFKSCLYLYVHRLSNAGFVQRFCLSRIVMRTSPHKHRVCAVLYPRFLCVSFRYAYFASRLCVSFRYAYSASQTSGLCSACTSVPFGILRACVFVLRASPRKRRVCAMLFPRSPLKFVRLCLSYHVMRTSPHKHRVCAALAPRFPCEFVSFRYAYFTS